MFYFLFTDFYKQTYKKKQASTVRTGILVLSVNVIELFKFLLHPSVTQTAVCILSLSLWLPCTVSIAACSG